MQETITKDERGSYVSTLFDSLDEMADEADKYVKAAVAAHGYPGYLDRFREAQDYAHNGWDGNGDAIESLDLIRSAVSTSMAELNVDTVLPTFDVVGSAVDMGRYFAGDPECMVNFPLVKTSRAGKVIRLCASVDAYAGVSLYKRGLGIVALVEALTQCGHAVELYLDVFCNTYQDRYGYANEKWGGQIRCLIKSATDTLDLGKVMFGYAYEDTMRTLGMINTHRWPDAARRAQDIGGSYGRIGDPVKDLPEGTLYIPHAMHGVDLDPKTLTMIYLVQLGLAEDPGDLPPFNIWPDAED